MAALSFSLSPESVARIHDQLVCLAKFGEFVCLEARNQKLTITALNLSKTAYASFTLDARVFFLKYDFRSTSAANGDRFTCQLYNKALLSVFKGRAGDIRGRDSSIECCDVMVQDRPDKTECRIVIKMICKFGTTKTYRLTYESIEVMHALFDRQSASQGWKISARVLREYIEFFGPKTEQLDMVATEGKATFTSFTEKIQDGRQVLKQPLETAVAIHTEDFGDFHVQEDMHIVISVKDFKAIVTHAETLKGAVSARFSLPTRPLQFSYQAHGVHCEYTLMTAGDYRGASSTPNPRFISTRSSTRPPSVAPLQFPSRNASEMPPPPRPAASFSSSQRQGLRAVGKQPAAPTPDADPESLFVPGGDEDRTWDPPNYDQGDEEEMLGWDASAESNTGNHPTFRDSGRPARPSQQRANAEVEGLEPTQRLSQLHGLFD